MKVVPLRRPDLSGGQGRTVDEGDQVVGVDGPGNQGRGFGEAPDHRRIIQPKPAGPAGRFHLLIDRDDLEIGVSSKAHDVIVGAHHVVAASRRDFHAKLAADKFNTLGERGGGDDEVVQIGIQHRWKPASRWIRKPQYTHERFPPPLNHRILGFWSTRSHYIASMDWS